MKYLCVFCFFLLYLFTIHSSAPSNKYNIFISENPKFVWFRTAKTGSRSVLKILKDNKIVMKSNSDNIVFLPDQHQDYFKFTFVRNPWERVLSCYFNKVLTKAHPYYTKCFDKDFDFFINFINQQDLVHADSHIRLQTHLIPLEYIDFIGHLETFSEDLQYITSVLGIPSEAIPHVGQTNHSHYSQYYSEDTKNIIERKYKEDIEAFGYQFEYGEIESKD